MRLLAQPRRNIFVVGDDDQSIYGFRGAKPEMMQRFLKDYPEAEQCVLGVNYRCAAPIVAAAGRVIAKNKNRLPKKVTAAKKNSPNPPRGSRNGKTPTGENHAFLKKGDKKQPVQERSQMAAQTNDIVEIREFAQLAEENETIRAKILAYREQGIPYSEMAVLFRTNTQARSLSAKLMEFNIPFTMKERLPNLYEHWIVQDILTYVRVAQGGRERGQVLRIINRPKRYVHRNAFTEPYVDFEELKRFYEDKDWMVERLEQLQYDLSMLAKMKPYATVNFIRRGIGYDEYIREYADYRGIRADDMMEILDELLEEARGQESFEAWFDYMQAYKEELKEQAKKRQDMRGETEDAVMLMTMHGAKGLEFECVFIPDANEGITPHSKSVLDADMEEERRMFYVAMTRAKEHLHIYYLRERFHKQVDVSRFVQEIQQPPA
jgi:DNA helicase-2/ATP-dependent DNA helicase PcrA